MRENIKDLLILITIMVCLAIIGSFYGFSADDIMCVSTQEIKL